MTDQMRAHSEEVGRHGNPNNRAGLAVRPNVTTYFKVVVVTIAALMGLAV